MTWALIIMLCNDTCTPQYVEAHTTKESCMAKVDKQASVFRQPRSYCVPIVK